MRGSQNASLAPGPDRFHRYAGELTGLTISGASLLQRDHGIDFVGWTRHHEYEHMFP
jgi:hypothetical protein